MPNGNCPVGAAHAQQIRMLEEGVERIDQCLSHKAGIEHLEKIEAKVDRVVGMFWALVMLIISNLVGIILMLLKPRL